MLSMRSQVRNFLIAISLVLAVLCLGVTGFVLIEGWPWFDAFYMTIITLSTVGFTEIHPLSQAGRLFTAGLIACGVSVAAYAFATISRTVVEGELLQLRRRRRMDKRIASYSGHTIVCGFGRLAEAVVNELIAAGVQIVAIENDPEFAEELYAAEVPFVIGSAYEDETLKAANIEKAKNLLALLPKDADNVYISLCARDLNPNITIVARTEDRAGEKKLMRAGANRVIAPYRVAGLRLVQQLIRPSVSEFLELTGIRSGLVLEEVVVPENSPVAGKTIENSELRGKTGAFIAAIIEPGGAATVNPPADTTIRAGTTLIILGKAGSLEAVTGLVAAR